MSTMAPKPDAVPDDPEHRRIAWFAAVAWPLLVLALPVFGAWLFYRVISCSSRVWQPLCEWGFLAPLILGGLITALLGVDLWTLLRYERKLADAGSFQELSPPERIGVTHRVRRGYRRLHRSHRRYVRRSILVFSMALGAFLGFAAFFLRLPALASMLIGLAVLGGAIVFNWWARSGAEVV
jgi:hypothetical protein